MPITLAEGQDLTLDMALAPLGPSEFNIQAYKSTFIHEPEYGGGYADWLAIARTDSRFRTLLAFDLSAIPPSAVIESAVLGMYYYYSAAPNEVAGLPVVAYPCSQTDWSWDEYDPAADRYYASWDQYRKGSYWLNPGGDYATDKWGVTVVPDNYGFMAWPVTDIIRDAHAAGIDASMLVKFEPEDPRRRHWAIRFAKHTSSNENRRPALVIHTA